MQEAAQLLDTRLFWLGDTPLSVATLVTLIVVGLLTFLLSRLAQRAVTRMLPLVGVKEAGNVAAVARLAHYTTLAVGFSIVLQTLGIDLSGLFAAGALFAVGLGFATRNIVENFFSGLILLTERAIKPGDVLEVDGRVVRVSNMGIRSTIVRTRDEEDLILPNSLLAQGAVTNYTLRDSLYRLRTQVGVSYGSDLDVVRETLERAATEVPGKAAGHAPVVLLTGFGSSSVDYEVSVWVQDPWSSQQTRSLLNESIWRALKQAHVTIAFPQVDVHFDPPIREPHEDLHGT